MEKKKLNRKPDVVIFSLLFILIIYLGTEMYRTSKYFSDELPREIVGSIELSEEDMMNDFEYLWSSVTEGMPLLETYKNEMGYDFAARKEMYAEKISKCSTNFDFMCCIESVLNDVPSAHTAFFRSDYDDITSYMCPGYEFVRTEPKLCDMTNLWGNEARQYYSGHRYSAVDFSYAEGRYFADSSRSDSTELSGYELTGIDGMTPDEYILSTLSVYHMIWDNSRGKLYRPCIMFNRDGGSEVSVTVKNPEGGTETLRLYCDLDFEYALYYGTVEIVEDSETNFSAGNIDDSTVYLCIDGFSGKKGVELTRMIRDFCFKENLDVILDLRENGGGNTAYVRDEVYPYLFSETLTSDETLYIYKSDAVKKLYTGLYGLVKYASDFDKSDFRMDSDIYTNRFLEGKSSYEYRGLNTFSPDITVLVSRNTASAADGFVSLVSGFDNTVIVGTNTGGEKLGGQYMDLLPASKLVYMFVPSLSFNDDGTDNSVYGTSPDIYSELTAEGFMKRESLIRENPGRDVYSISDRLLWDDVLKTALENKHGK